jgi:hypothetical protein
MFHDTVGNNLRYARPAATAAEMDPPAARRRSTNVITPTSTPSGPPSELR